MKRILWAAATGCVLAIFPIVVLRLPSDSGIIGSLKWGVSDLAVPGTLVGFLASGGKIDDISQALSSFSNFLFYFILAYLALSVWAKLKNKFSRRPASSDLAG
jgi:hypothetical protein